MRLKSLFIVLLAMCIIKSYGQEPNKKVNLGTTANYGFLGDGDFGGFYYNNSILYSIRPSFQVSAAFGFLISSNDGENDINLSHNNSYLIGDLFLKIIPIKTKNIDLYFGFGYSNRYRAEIVLQSIFIYNEETTITYKNETSFDFGYMSQVGLGFKINPKITIIFNGELHGYNKGTAISSIGLGVNIKL